MHEFVFYNVQCTAVNGLAVLNSSRIGCVSDPYRPLFYVMSQGGTFSLLYCTAWHLYNTVTVAAKRGR